MSLKEESVILWGPTGSGKTSLLHAFVKKVERINILNTDFFFSAKDWQSGFPFQVRIGKERSKPTASDSEDELLVVKRLPKVKTRANELSCAFEYQVHFKDYKGDFAVDRAIVDNFLDSDNILITLDPYSSPSSYESDLGRLQAQLEQRAASKKIRVAICVTKIDCEEETTLVNRNGDISASNQDIRHYIQRKFGDRVVNLIDMFIAQSNYFDAKMFLTSSAGFIFDQKEQRKISNARGIGKDHESDGEIQDWLKDVQKWNPVGVTDPIFWIFNLHEDKVRKSQKSLFASLWGKNTNDDYKPWPVTNYQ